MLCYARSVCGGLIAVVILMAAVAPAAVASTSPRPNIVIFVADDQSLGTVVPGVMPHLFSLMVAGGRVYPNFTIASPLCCPSRGSIMTGRYPHNTHVWSNDTHSPLNIELATTIQCYLHRAGYLTAFFGKFLNGFPITFRQPCLSEWAINPGQTHGDVNASIDGVVHHVNGYIDEFDLSRASVFLDDAERQDARPWYVYFSDSYPHSPYVPRPVYADTVIPPPPGTEGPALNEADLSDKPAFEAPNRGAPSSSQTLENELRMLKTVDQHFATLVADLIAHQELSRTLIFYVSDNGYLFGEHGLWGKDVPYTEAAFVPFMVRWPGHVAPGSIATRAAQNVDIAPTIFAAARTGLPPIHPFDGRNLMRYWQRPMIYGESFHTPWDQPRDWRPTWHSIRTSGYQYTEWVRNGSVIAREYYDLAADPYQLVNLLHDGDPDTGPDAARIAALHQLILTRLHCAGAGCR